MFVEEIAFKPGSLIQFYMPGMMRPARDPEKPK
jgi:hypothetical protein